MSSITCVVEARLTVMCVCVCVYFLFPTSLLGAEPNLLSLGLHLHLRRPPFEVEQLSISFRRKINCSR